MSDKDLRKIIEALTPCSEAIVPRIEWRGVMTDKEFKRILQQNADHVRAAQMHAPSSGGPYSVWIIERDDGDVQHLAAIYSDQGAAHRRCHDLMEVDAKDAAFTGRERFHWRVYEFPVDAPVG